MENKFEITANVLGPDEGVENEIHVLNRTLRWTDSGITYEPDQRHAEIIIKELNLFESSKNTTEPHKSAQRRSNPVGHSSSSRKSCGIARMGQQRVHGQTRCVTISCSLSQIELPLS